MNRSKAMSLAAKWAEGGVCTLREDEAREYHKICLEALRAQREAANNAPLTLDELRKMDGEPVWIVWPDGRIKSKWWIVDNYDWHMMEFDDRNDYGKTWVAYRHKAGGGDDVKENCAECKHHDIFWGGSGCNLLNNGERCKFEPHKNSRAGEEDKHD